MKVNTFEDLISLMIAGAAPDGSNVTDYQESITEAVKKFGGSKKVGEQLKINVKMQKCKKDCEEEYDTTDWNDFLMMWDAWAY